MNRIEREKRTVSAMIELYCRQNHGGKELCEQCREVMAYSHARLERCVMGDSKRSCRMCEVHCYSPKRRAEIREVMRYAGPRMMLRHPIMALRHLWGEIR